MLPPWSLRRSRPPSERSHSARCTAPATPRSARSTASAPTSPTSSSPRSWDRPAPASPRSMHCLAGLDSPTSGQVFRIGAARSWPALTDDAAHHAAPGPRRVRLPVVQPAARADRRGEHHAAAGLAGRGRPGLAGRQVIGRRPGGPARAPARPSCPAASSSGSPGPGPGQPAGDHLRRRAHRQPGLPGQRRRGARLPAPSVRELGQTVVMVTHDPVAAATPTGCCSWPTAGSPASSTGRRPNSVLDWLRSLGGEGL